MTLATRAMLVAFGVLTALAFVALFLGANRTATSFAWTIAPPLSAAFLGAAYGAGCILVVLTLRTRSWGSARAPLMTICVFAVLTLVATLMHLDRFHFGAGGLASVAAWFWLAVYVVVPVGLAVVIVLEERRHGGSAAVAATLQGLPLGLAIALRIEAAVLAATGAGLYLGADAVMAAWPWPLTPLVARVIGAWLLAFALAAALAVRTDARRLGPSAVAYTCFAALELLALAVHAGDAEPGTSLLVFVTFLFAVAVTGAAGVRVALRADGTVAGGRGGRR